MNPWVAVTLFVVLAVTAIIIYERFLAPRLLRRSLMKHIANAGKSDPRILEHAKNGTILCDAEFIRLTIGNQTQQIPWRDIDEVYAYKMDLFTVDQICIVFLSHTKELGMKINEEMVGYRDALDRFPIQFPSYSYDWFTDVAFPAFAENRRTIWKKTE
jgi:uncharacterized protein YneF (UPF0154 family)